MKTSACAYRFNILRSKNRNINLNLTVTDSHNIFHIRTSKVAKVAHKVAKVAHEVAKVAHEVAKVAHTVSCATFATLR